MKSHAHHIRRAVALVAPAVVSLVLAGTAVASPPPPLPSPAMRVFGDAILLQAEPLVREQGGLGEDPGPNPPIEDGGGYAGCWRLMWSDGENHWYGDWRHHFNPYWCGNGNVVTYVDGNWHYQTSNGLYGTNGIGRWHAGGCVGCPYYRFHAQGRFTLNISPTGSFDCNVYADLQASNGWVWLYHFGR